MPYNMLIVFIGTAEGYGVNFYDISVDAAL